MQGNDNLAQVIGFQYITTGAASDASAALSPQTKAVQLYASAACYVAIGASPTAAAPSGEKVRATSSFRVPADVLMTVYLPTGTDAAPMKVAAIQDTTSGQLDIWEMLV